MWLLGKAIAKRKVKRYTIPQIEGNKDISGRLGRHYETLMSNVHAIILSSQ